MKLTESKFLIQQYAKHQRPEPVGNHPVRVATNDKLGPEGLRFGPHEFELGTLQELHSRSDSCPFCSLAVRSLDYQRDVYLKDKQGNKNEENFYKAAITCFVSWQIDGRIMIRDLTGKVTGTRPCTRRIRLRWDTEKERLQEEKERFFEEKDKLFDTYVVLMAPLNGTKGLFLGRSPNSVKKDAALIPRWIGFCEDAHGDRCKPQTKNGPLSNGFFGVVDVAEMRLTKLPPGERYFALSYTWGKGGRPFVTKKDNIKSLLADGGLRKWLPHMPRTIRDAIKLVIDLRGRYLWIDSLCIIQDSDRSWALNSRIMDVVYGNAYLTICAADGNNSNAWLRGLHGMSAFDSRPDRPESQNIEQYDQNIRLMCTQPVENYIRHSAWNTRGWTFQERLLSARNLIFVAGRMYFQCRCVARSVDIFTEYDSAEWSIEFKDSPLLMLHKLPYQPLSVYKQSLQLYMNRELTHDKDILAAFTGIGNRICGALGGSLVFGLPSSHFDWALLWEPRHAAVRRENEGTEMFPSWSWCGWRKDIMEYKPEVLAGCEDNLHDWLMKHTWITWYIRDWNGNLRLVWDGDSQHISPAQSESTSRGYSNIRCKESTSHDKYGRCIKEDEKKLSRSEDFKLVLDDCPYDVNIINNSDTYNRNSTEKDMPYLQFFTWRAFFRVREDQRFSQDAFGKPFLRYSIEDYKDDWCGTIMLDKFWISKHKPDNTFEFIAISEAKQFDDTEYGVDDWANYIPLERQESSWDLYYVLLVDRDPNTGISYRMGLGKVFKDAFENSCRPGGKEWREFILG